MDDVKAVDWLPLDAAIDRLSRSHERAFLENVGPLALEAAALARPARPVKAKKPPVAEKRRRRPAVAPPVQSTIPMSVPLQPDLTAPANEQDQRPPVDNDVVEAETSVASAVFGTAAPPVKEVAALTTEVTDVEPRSGNRDTVATARGRRINLMQKVRNWLRRAA
jgi:8-oxo-dGTP diphosphatase